MKFPIINLAETEYIFLHGVGENLKGIVGLSKKIIPSKSLRMHYYWVRNERPINLVDLKKIVGDEKAKRLLLDTTSISVSGSPHKVKLPKNITKDLAYLCGYHMGDGCIGRRDFTISYMDSKMQLIKISDIYKKNFGKKLTIKKVHGKNVFVGYITSKAIATILNCCLEFPIGKKEKLFYPSWIRGDLKNSFVVGFIDAEFGIKRKKFEFSGSSIDFDFLKRIQKDLFEMGLETKMYGPYYSHGDPRPRWFLKNCKKEAIKLIKDNKIYQHPEGLITLNKHAPL